MGPERLQQGKDRRRSRRTANNLLLLWSSQTASTRKRWGRKSKEGWGYSRYLSCVSIIDEEPTCVHPYSIKMFYCMFVLKVLACNTWPTNTRGKVELALGFWSLILESRILQRAEKKIWTRLPSSASLSIWSWNVFHFQSFAPARTRAVSETARPFLRLLAFRRKCPLCSVSMLRGSFFPYPLCFRRLGGSRRTEERGERGRIFTWLPASWMPGSEHGSEKKPGWYLHAVLDSRLLNFG